MGEKRVIIPDAHRLVEEVLDRATPRALSSSIHGPRHWQRVGLAGLKLLKRVPEADAETIFLFALVHDSQRVNDGKDPDHGPRAARLVRDMDQDLIFPTEEQYDRLTFACRHHERGGVSDDPTVSVCWDADRLNLHRCYIWPKTKYLSTSVARKRILWAYELQQQSVTWEELIQSYGLQRGCAMR